MKSGVDANESMGGVSHFLWLGPPKRTLRSAEARVSQALSKDMVTREVRAHPNHRHRLDHDAGSNYQRKHEALGQWNSQHPTQDRCDLLYVLKQRQMRETLKGSPELHLQRVRSQSLWQKPLFWSFACTHGPALSGSFNLGIIWDLCISQNC